MESIQSNHIAEAEAPPTFAGELVLQNGRQAGTRRPFSVPTTFIGRSPGCEIRLNIDGVDPMHCVLVVGPDGLQVRDLNSAHGTFVNGDRIVATPIHHGDLLKIGPFQFRVETNYAALIPSDGRPNELTGELREAIQVQVAAVVAQQISLEEEEARLTKRQTDMQQQEEQLANHLAEKQRQVQMWSQHTKAERAALRQQKAEQHKTLSHLQGELNQAKETLEEEQLRVHEERERIQQVYHRLKQRWQRQWSSQKAKFDRVGDELETEKQALTARAHELSEREARLAAETKRFQAESQRSSRELQEGWETLKTAQAAWRRRHTHERALWKTREQEVAEAVASMNSARSLLLQEREAWKKQQEAMQKELFGLNNRVVHQRQKIKEQEERVHALDAELRTRLLNLRRVGEFESNVGQAPESVIAAETAAALEAEQTAASIPPADLPDLNERIEALDQLAGELADQRVHLVEQYQRLAEVQELWSIQREQAADEMEVVARKLHDQEQSLQNRERETAANEQTIKQEHDALRLVRREVHAWRSRLKSREHALEQDHQHRLASCAQQQELLQEQLAGLTQLRQRWNRRRQDEIEFVRSEQEQLKQQREEVSRLRQQLFDRGQQLEDEKRIVAEKALAVELYRQEVTRKAADPAAERKIERLRRRWLMQNSVILRDAKQERERVRGEMAELDSRCDDWLKQMEAVIQADAVLAEKLSVLEERETLLAAQARKVDLESAQQIALRQEALTKLQRMRDEVDQMSRFADDSPETADWSADKAA